MSDLIKFPTPQVGVATTLTPNIISANRIRLFEGKLVLYKRAGHATENWHYSIQTPDGYERKSAKTTDLAEATKLASNRFHEIKWRIGRGLTVNPSTFADAAQRYLLKLDADKLLGAKHTTRPKQVALINRYLLPYFGDHALCDITQGDIDAYHKGYLAHWEEQHKAGGRTGKPSAVSMRTHESVIKRIFDLAVEQRLIVAAERSSFKPTKARIRTRGAFEPHELATLSTHLHHQATLPVNKRFQRLRKQLAWYVDFVAATGMRPGVEPCSVRFKDIQPKLDDAVEPHVLIQVRDGKRGPRKVKVNLQVLKIVDGIRALHSSPTDDTLLFKLEDTYDGGRFVASFKQVLQDLGMSTDAVGAPRSLYSLRHTAITDMLMKGRNISFIAANCGTSAHQIEHTYSHIDHTMMRGQV